MKRRMRKILYRNLYFLSFCPLLVGLIPGRNVTPLSDTQRSKVYTADTIDTKKSISQKSIYDSLHLGDAGLSRVAYEHGLAGLIQLASLGEIHNAGILSIIDLSLPSSKKRFFVIDLNARTLVFNTYVSHGRNSGKEMATQFSNRPRSCESSLGFYVTGETYSGHNGYSLRLIGKEQGINDNACSRGIVIHSASYVNERIAKKQGYIGRSEGCPAIPKTVHRNIIEKIKNGTCLFLYSPNSFYATHSKMKLFQAI